MKAVLTVHKKKFINFPCRTVFIFCCFSFLFLNLLAYGFFPAAVFADDKQVAFDFKLLKERKFSRNTPLISQSVLAKMTEIQKQINDQNNQKADETLKVVLVESKNLSAYEKAQLFNLKAYLNYSAANYSQAISDYQKILQAEELTASLFNDTLYALAQLYYLTDSLDNSLSFMDVWLARNPKPGALAFELLGQIYYRQGKFSEGIAALEKGIHLSREQNKIPAENSYRLLMAMLYEKKNIPEVEKVLKHLLLEYPKREYWIQLAAIYGLQNKYKQQLATLDLAYLQNFLETENEYLSLAHLYLSAAVPFKAAKLLDDALKQEIVADTAQNRSLLANAWSLARELDEAIVEMEKAAALSEDGDLYFRLGQIYLSAGRYQLAAQTFNSALKKEYKNQTQLYTYLAISYVQLKDWAQAQAAFDKARGSVNEKAEPDVATLALIEQWLLYMRQMSK